MDSRWQFLDKCAWIVKKTMLWHVRSDLAALVEMVSHGLVGDCEMSRCTHSVQVIAFRGARPDAAQVLPSPDAHDGKGRNGETAGDGADIVASAVFEWLG